MYNILNSIKNIERHITIVNLINSELIDLTKTLEDDINKIEEMNKIADIAELILNLDNDDQ